MTHIQTLPDPEAVASEAAAEIARRVEEARELRSVVHLALSGGSTPRRTYELLAQTLNEWEGVDMWFIDERCVPPDDEQSNYLLAADTLLRPAGIPDARVHRMPGELGPDEGARRYAEELRAHGLAPAAGRPAAGHRHPAPAGHGEHEPAQGGAGAIDVAVLGIGPDGHIASLFPHHPALKAGDEELCLGIGDSPKPPPQRITLTLPLLRAARHCMVVATGQEKAGAISAMLGDPTEAVPASLLPRERLSVIVDDAASGAPGSPWLAHGA